MTPTEVLAGDVGRTASGPFGSNLVGRDYVTSGVPVIRGQNMNGRWVSGEFAFVSEDKAKQLSGNLATPGDVVFTQRGTLGQLSIVPAGQYQRYVLSQSQMKLSPDSTKADAMFLYYLFNGEEQQDYIRRNATQAGVPHTNLGFLRSTPIRLPNVQEQRAIAGVLGALDDKIELNRRLNETLDATTEALFDELVSRTAESGSMVKIGDRLKTLLGGTPSRARPDYWSGGSVGWINSGEVNRFRIVQPTALITNDALASSAAKLLPQRTTVIAITGATLGQVSLTEIETSANQSVVGVLGSEELPSEYVYLWFRSRIDDLISRQTGGAQQHVNKADVNDFEIFQPPFADLTRWLKVSRPLFDLIRSRCLESRTLAELRDALLPKLITGELRVRDSETRSARYV